MDSVSQSYRLVKFNILICFYFYSGGGGFGGALVQVGNFYGWLINALRLASMVSLLRYHSCGCVQNVSVYGCLDRYLALDKVNFVLFRF